MTQVPQRRRRIGRILKCLHEHNAEIARACRDGLASLKALRPERDPEIACPGLDPQPESAFGKIRSGTIKERPVLSGSEPASRYCIIRAPRKGARGLHSNRPAACASMV